MPTCFGLQAKQWDWKDKMEQTSRQNDSLKELVRRLVDQTHIAVEHLHNSATRLEELETSCAAKLDEVTTLADQRLTDACQVLCNTCTCMGRFSKARSTDVK